VLLAAPQSSEHDSALAITEQFGAKSNRGAAHQAQIGLIVGLREEHLTTIHASLRHMMCYARQYRPCHSGHLVLGVGYNTNFSRKHAGCPHFLKVNGYDDGTSQAQVAILLHELAHLLGSANFQADFGNPGAGAANDRLVRQNCNGTSNAARNIP
jgi:hypothetical protein